MTTEELNAVVGRGEDSRHQFKIDVSSPASLAAEMVAFANSGGGQIFLGVDDLGTVVGLSREDVHRLNQLVANVSSEIVRPAIIPVTENVAVEGGVVIVISVPDGPGKPYMDRTGAIWVRQGSDKRRVSSREEMQRMFQRAHLLYGESVPVPGSSIEEIDRSWFLAFYRKCFDVEFSEQGISLSTALQNMRLMVGEELNTAGLLLFGSNPAPLIPSFHIKCVTYPGTDIHVDEYIDSADAIGRIDMQFENALAFVLRHLRREQRGQSVNSIGILEVPRIVFEELLANALIHRDYFVPAPIRLFVFDDRIEIISPGHLPNNLTIDNIRSGNSNIRNPVLASYATSVLPYRGLGNGVVRALREYPDIDFVDDREANRFVAIVRRNIPGWSGVG